MAEEMLDAPLAWNEVPDLIMETEDSRMFLEAATKRKRDEVALGRRKDDIRLEKNVNILPQDTKPSRMIFRRLG